MTKDELLIEILLDMKDVFKILCRRSGSQRNVEKAMDLNQKIHQLKDKMEDEAKSN